MLERTGSAPRGAWGFWDNVDLTGVSSALFPSPRSKRCTWLLGRKHCRSSSVCLSKVQDFCNGA